MLNREVLGSLGEVVSHVHKVHEVMGKIVAASAQQQLGIVQLDSAVGQLNQGTQETAASAEEAASTAEELSSQAAEMQHLVETFHINQGHASSMSRLLHDWDIVYHCIPSALSPLFQDHLNPSLWLRKEVARADWNTHSPACGTDACRECVNGP